MFLLTGCTSNNGCLCCTKSTPCHPGTRRHVFTYEQTLKSPSRNKEEHRFAIGSLTTKTAHVNGFQGVPFVEELLNLSGVEHETFDLLLLDALHTIDHGASTEFMKQFFGIETKGKPYNLLDEIESLANILNDVQVPHWMKKLPSLLKWRSWKASDLRTFVCYYGVFVLRCSKLFGTKYYQTWCDYCDAVRVICSRRAYVGDLKDAKKLFRNVASKSTIFANQQICCNRIVFVFLFLKRIFKHSTAKNTCDLQYILFNIWLIRLSSLGQCTVVLGILVKVSMVI